MPSDCDTVAGPSPTTRSRVSNGRALFVADADGRSAWARRFRDLIAMHSADKGGPDNISEGERSIIRRAAALEVELERLEARFATAGEADAADLDLYGRTSNTLRRHLETLGIQRKPRDISGKDLVDAYVRQTYGNRGDAA